MTREEVVEKINNNEDVYCVTESKQIINGKTLDGCDVYTDPLYANAEWFETLKDAEWHKEFKRIPRTDYLDFPTWEEFRVIGSFAFYDYKHNPISMMICLDPVNVAPCNDCIYIADKKNDYFCKPKTKENYTLACRKAKSLFLGEKE